MKDKLEVGMYVRTNMGDISKIKSIWENERVFFKNKVDIDWFISDSFGISYLKKCRASYNIIDILEEGDYVNGHRVDKVVIDSKCSYVLLEEVGCYVDSQEDIADYEIKSIVTSQQFESMQYEVD